MPAEISALAPKPGNASRFIFIPVVLFLVVIIILFQNSIWFRNYFPAAWESDSAAAPAANLPVLMDAPTVADQVIVSESAPLPETAVILIPMPSETSISPGSPHGFEMIKIPPGSDRAYLIHIVAAGETLDMIATNYKTSVQAIIAVNYKLTPPVWVDYPIVIPVGIKDATGFPSFKVYLVKDYETISAETLANILAVDVIDLEFYNLCSGNCQFTRGDVLLIPQNP